MGISPDVVVLYLTAALVMQGFFAAEKRRFLLYMVTTLRLGFEISDYRFNLEGKFGGRDCVPCPLGLSLKTLNVTGCFFVLSDPVHPEAEARTGKYPA